MTDSTQSYTEPKNKGSREEEPQPIWKWKWMNIEQRSSKANDEHLTQQNETGYEEETTTITKLRPHLGSGKATGVEQIPELEQNEEGEKDAQLVVR